MEIDRKEQRKLQQRYDILEAAERVFAQQGYHNTTMDAVAEECGWSKGTLYLHFKHKEDLFFSLLISKIEILSETVIGELEKTDSLDVLIDKLIGVQFNYFVEHKHFLQLAMSEQGKAMQGSSSGMREEMVEQQINYINRITELIAFHLKDDSPISPLTLARSVSGAVHIHMMGWLIHPEGMELHDLKTEIKELYLNGISQYKKS